MTSLFLLFLAFSSLKLVIAQLSSSVQLFPNTTTAPSSNSSPAITSSPVTTTANGTNSTCPDCALFLGPQVLQQIVWFTDTIGITLDTVSVQITQYPGNATAITNTITKHGDLRTVNATTVPAALAISTKNIQFAVAQYGGGGSIFLASGTDGTIDDATSLAWPTAYVRVSSVVSYTTEYDAFCPSRSYGTGPCGCALATTINPVTGGGGMTSALIPLGANFYFPIPPSGLNLTMLESDMVNEFAYLNIADFSSWLYQQPWAISAIPNLDRCIILGAPQGPPAVKIPVSALTASVTTTIQGVLPPKSPAPQPANQVTSPIVSQTTQPGPANVPSTPSPQGTAGSGNTASSEGAGGASNRPYDASTPKQQVPTQYPSYSGIENSGQGGGNVAPVVQSSTTGEAVPASPNPVVTSSGGGNPDIHYQPANQPNQVFTAAIHIITASAGAVLLGGQTIQPGAPAITVPGAIVSLGNSGLVVGTSTIAIPLPDSGSSALTVAGQTFTAVPGGVIVSGSTLSPGGPALSLSGTPIVLGSSGLVVGTSTIALPTPTPNSSTFTVAGQTFTLVPDGGVAISDSTLSAGGPAMTISETRISVGPSDIIVGSSTTPIYNAVAPSATFIIGGETFTANPTGINIAGTTLQAGGPPITISSTAISLGSSGLIIGGTTIPLPTPAPSSTTFVLGSQTFTANPSAIAISGTILTYGSSAATISGTAISLGASGLVVGSSTYALPTSLPSSILVTDGQTLTIRPTGIVVDGTTLSEGGPAITVSGAPISLGTAGLVIGSSTVSFKSGPLTASSDGIGGAIIAGFGPTLSAPTAASSPQAFVGGAGKTAMLPSVLGLLGCWGMWFVVLGALVEIGT